MLRSMPEDEAIEYIGRQLRDEVVSAGFGRIFRVEAVRTGGMAGYLSKITETTATTHRELAKGGQLPVDTKKGTGRVRPSPGFLPALPGSGKIVEYRREHPDELRRDLPVIQAMRDAAVLARAELQAWCREHGLSKEVRPATPGPRAWLRAARPTSPPWAPSGPFLLLRAAIRVAAQPITGV